MHFDSTLCLLHISQPDCFHVRMGQLLRGLAAILFAGRVYKLFAISLVSIGLA